MGLLNNQGKSRPAAARSWEKVRNAMKNTYTVMNWISGKRYGDFTNKKAALKKAAFVRKMGRDPLPGTGFEKSAVYHTVVIKNYIEVKAGDDPDAIEEINKSNII